MSGESSSTSTVAGSVILRRGRPSRRAEATPSRIRSRAASGCRCSAAYRLTERFTSIVSMPGQNGATSGPTYWSPVITATGTPWCWATSALRPASPVTMALRRTSAIARGL